MLPTLGSRTVAVYEKVLPTSLDWPATFHLAARSGYSAYELSIDESPERQHRLDWTHRQRRSVRDAAAAKGINILTVALSAHRAHPWGSTDASVRARADELATKAIILAADLGAPCVQIAGYFTFYDPPNPRGRDLFLDGLARAADLAHDEGIVLALENVDGTDVTSIDDGLALLSDIGSPAVQLYVDIGNLAGNALDVPAQLHKALDSTFAVQLKDARPGQFRRVPFGTGTVPFQDVFRTLNTHGYDGPLSIEMWNDDNRETLATEALTWLSGQLLQVGNSNRDTIRTA